MKSCAMSLSMVNDLISLFLPVKREQEYKKMAIKAIDKDLLREDPDKGWIYAVGNINGSLKLLEKMIERIEGSGLAKNDKIVFLGNFISTLGDNKKIIRMLQEYSDLRPEQVVILRGRNEHKMVQSRLNFFQSSFGKNTLNCYRTHTVPYNIIQLGIVNKDAFALDREWLNSLPYYYKSNKYFFAHSGVNPKLTLDKQHVGGLLSIQDPFYESDRRYEKIIVHSTTREKSEFKANRIGIGQGSQKKCQLSCYVLNDLLPPNAEPPKNFGKTVEAEIRVEV